MATPDNLSPRAIEGMIAHLLRGRRPAERNPVELSDAGYARYRRLVTSLEAARRGETERAA